MPTIRELRERRGWSQFELAKAVDVTTSAVYSWEAGRATPKVPQLRKLAETFAVRMDDIQLVPRRPKHQIPLDRAPST